MANTKSAKKALRSSVRKRQFNSLWKSRIKNSMKTLNKNLKTKKVDVAILNSDLMVLQKVLDKAAKNDVIHKNKANRLKSRYAKRISAQTEGKPSKNTAKKDSGKRGESSSKESKS